VVDFCLDPLFSWTFSLCSPAFVIKNRFHTKPQRTLRPQSPTNPHPSSSGEGAAKSPSLDKEGSGVDDFCVDPLFSQTFPVRW